MKPYVVVVLLLTTAVMYGVQQHRFAKQNFQLHAMQDSLADAVREEIDRDLRFPDVSVTFDYLDGRLEGVVATEEHRAVAEEIALRFRSAGRITNELAVQGQAADAPEAVAKAPETAAPPAPAPPRAPETAPAPEMPPVAVSPQPQPAIPSAAAVEAPSARAPAPAPSAVRIVARLSGGEIQLEGVVASEEMKTALAGAVRSLGPEKVSDRLQVKADLPVPEWHEKLDEVLAEAGRILERGGPASASEVELSGETLSIRQDLDIRKVLPPDRDATFTARLQESGWQLGGALHDESLETALLTTAKAVRPGDLSDDVTTSWLVRAPSWEKAIVPFFKEFFTGATTGELELGPAGIRLKRHVDGIQAKDTILASARALLPRGGIVTDEITFPPDQEASLLASLSRERLTLRGKLPDEALKREILSAVAGFGLGNIDEQLEVSQRAKPAPWATGIGPFLSQFLVGAQSGELELTAKTLRLKRGISGEEAKKSMLARAKSFLPDGYQLTDELSLNPDREATLIATTRGNTLLLEGTLPDPAMLDAIQSALAPLQRVVATETLKLNDRVKAPLWKDAIGLFLAGFFRDVEGGSVRIGGDRFSVTGEVASLEARKALTASLQAVPLPEGTLVTDEVICLAPQPFELALSRTGTALSISGVVATSEFKARLSSRAKSPPKGDSWDTGPVFVGTNVPTPSWVDRVPEFLGLLPEKFPERRKLILNSRGITWNAVAPDSEQVMAQANFEGSPIPENWPEFTASLVKAAEAGRTRNAEILQNDDGVVVLGTTPDSDGRDRFLATLMNSLPETDVLVAEVGLKTQNPADHVPAHRTFNLYYNSGESALDEAGLAELQAALDYGRQTKAADTVLIKGFADYGNGTLDVNRWFATDRVQRIRKRFKSEGWKPEQLHPIVFGEKAIPEDSRQRRENRRVEVTILH